MTMNDDTALDSSWISFNPISLILSLTPTSVQSSPTIVKLIAEDAYNDPTESLITITIKFKPKDNPSVIERTGTFVCQSFSYFEISRNILIDEDIISSYTVTLNDSSPIPSWLQVYYPDETTSGDFRFSGTYPTLDNTLYNFTISAQDSDGMIGTASFYIQSKRKNFILMS